MPQKVTLTLGANVTGGLNLNETQELEVDATTPVRMLIPSDNEEHAVFVGVELQRIQFLMITSDKYFVEDECEESGERVMRIKIGDSEQQLREARLYSGNALKLFTDSLEDVERLEQLSFTNPLDRNDQPGEQDATVTILVGWKAGPVGSNGSAYGKGKQMTAAASE